MGFIINGEQYRWPDSEIRYKVDPDLLAVPLAAQTVYRAINNWNNDTRFRLVELGANENDVRDYLKFQLALTHCQTPVGRRGGEQVVGCALTTLGFNDRSVMHEIGHAVGMYHEHQRPDRDDYVDVTDNAVNDEPQNYEPPDDGSIVTPYDCESVMHYPPITGEISTKTDGCTTIGGTIPNFTSEDIETINSLIPLFPYGDAKSIAGGAGRLFMINQAGQVRRYVQDQDWVLLSNEPAKQITVANSLYMINNAGHVLEYTGTGRDWDPLPHDRAKQIVAKDDRIWMINQAGQVRRYVQDQDWVLLSNEPAKQITVGAGYLFMINNAGHVLRYTGTNRDWDPLPHEPAKQIVAGANRLFMINQAGQIKRYDGSRWQPLSNGPAKQIVIMEKPVIENSLLFFLSQHSEIWEYQAAPYKWLKLHTGSNISQICESNDALYRIQDRVIHTSYQT